jgi:hypothetical protein
MCCQAVVQWQPGVTLYFAKASSLPRCQLGDIMVASTWGRLNVHCVGSHYSNWIQFFHVFCVLTGLIHTDTKYSCVPGDQGGSICFTLKDFFSVLVFV